ncbi:hypothetical protein LA080_001600 [Diaporthe eres]|nr:hypothetical protein LA080_001600 [Diaporthe eres]
MASTIAALSEEAAQIIYTPLEPGTVRLVQLHPASDSKAGVVCSLEHARLGGNPRYQALSYVWGSQDDPREIRLNGTTVLVTQNLYNALRRLRLQHETRVIWVDALSINQSDIAERNVEVQVMRDIYSSAYETLAWLDRSLREDRESHLYTLTDPGYCPSSRENSRDVRETLSAIFRQRYWSRIWTAQEVRYSKHVTLVTTRSEIPFDRLLRLQDVVSSLFSLPRDGRYYQGTLGLPLRNFQRKCLSVRPLGLSDNGHLDLSSWIDICCLRICSDPRDFVFGLWAWFPPQVKTRVEVDYSLSTAQVLGSCKEAFLLTTGTLDFLGLSNLFGYTESATLPSWDPELYFRGPYKASGELRYLPELLRLDRDRRWSQAVFTRLSEDLRILHVRGTRIGIVTMAAAKMTDAGFGPDKDVFAFTFAAMESLQVKVEEAERFPFAVRPLDDGDDTNLPEDFVRVAEFLQSPSTEKGMIEDDICEIKARYHRKEARWGTTNLHIRQHFSVTRLEADASVATDGEETRELFGLLWYTSARPGDQVYLVHGCSRALLLRPEDRDPGKHKLIGSIFFPGPEGKENGFIDELLTNPDSPVTDIFIS